MKKILLLLLILTLSACTNLTTSTSKKTNERDAIMAYYNSWKGTRYKLGGTGRNGIDCSAFVQNLYKEVYGISLPRTTTLQVKEGEKIRRSSLQVGDLVFFKTGFNVRHVGVYVGNNEFVHASTSKGVIKSEIAYYWDDKYWQSRRMK